MSLSLQVIEANLEQSGTYLMSRATLDLPIINSSLSLSPYQQEALDLAVSNSPIALISGEPGSGKTRVGYLALSMAIQHQKSVLLVANHSNTLEAYNNLKIRPLRLDKSNNYLESVTIWLRDQFAEPKLNFSSPYLLADPLLETLQNRNDSKGNGKMGIEWR
jgi:superfamily II DNA or RNA helicase